ncbi:MAG: response regulator transcription factor [Nitrospirota bacterium]|nr:response regulator transcription factor [Nitrospirota bacterium]
MDICDTRKRESKYGVFIVDDHPLVRQGLATVINQQQDLAVCGESGDLEDALISIGKCGCDVITVDITLERSNGVRLIEELAHRRPELPTLVFSMHDEAVYAERCLRAGARGYIMKTEPAEKVIDAIRMIMKGEMYVSDNLGQRLLNKMVRNSPGVRDNKVMVLTNRELEVYQLFGQGLKTREVAAHMNLSVKTIESYVDKIKKKMGFDDIHDVIIHSVKDAVKL